MSFFPRFRLETINECESTNRELLDRSSSIHGAALFARRQSAGQGRRGRTWLAPEGNLSLSLGLEMPPHVWLPFLVGVELHKLLAPHVKGLSLKWPNDLFVGKRKLAGFLVQAKQQGDHARLVLGIGLNVENSPQDIPAVALREVWPDCPSAEVLAAKLVDHFSQLSAMPSADELKKEWESRCAHVRAKVFVHDEAEPREVFCVGLASDGGLCVRGEHGDEVIYAEDVSLRLTK